MTETRFARMKDLPSTHLLVPEHRCARVVAVFVLHEIYDILGNKTVFVNAAGCMTLLTIYPLRRFAVPGFIPRWFRASRRSGRPGCAGYSIGEKTHHG